MKTSCFRTNLFRFDPSLLPIVHQYHCPQSYRSAWCQMHEYALQNKKKLSSVGLQELLSVFSGGPVWINNSPNLDASLPVIVSVELLTAQTINLALKLWVTEAMQTWEWTSHEIPFAMTVDEGTPLDAIELLNNRPLLSRVYSILPWMASKAMQTAPLLSSIPLPLSLASDGSLVAWGNPVVNSRGNRQAIALHTIKPTLVLHRGQTDPYLSINVHLSHTLPEWKHSTNKAWVKTSLGLAKLDIKNQKQPDGSWKTVYVHDTDKLLSFAATEQLPELRQGRIDVHSLVRPIHAEAQQRSLIGSGAGPLFLDQACWHLLNTLPGTEVLLASRVIHALRRAKSQRTDFKLPTLRIAVLAAHSQTTRRLEVSRRDLASHSQVFKKAPPPLIEFIHLAVPQAQQFLCTDSAGDELDKWFEQQVLPELKASGAHVAIVETLSVETTAHPDQDPKFALRWLFAKHGVVTQFIRTAQIEGEDYQAMAVLAEAVRLSGKLPQPLPREARIPEGTWTLSVYLESIQTKGDAKYLPVITRVLLDDNAPQIFWFDAKHGNAPKWFDYRAGTALIHSTIALFSHQAVRKLIDQALLAPTPVAGEPLIIYLHSRLRELYDGLQDIPGQTLPAINDDNAWIVRISTDPHIARITGDHTASPSCPHFIGTRKLLLRSQHSESVYFHVSPSKLYASKGHSQRYNTRYDVNPYQLEDAWQQLGVTEMTIIREGLFSNAASVAAQTGLLCRNAPTWDGFLRLPSSMHLGSAVARTHPMIQRPRRA